MFYFRELRERGVAIAESAVNQLIFREEHIELKLMVSLVLRPELLFRCIKVF